MSQLEFLNGENTGLVVLDNFRLERSVVCCLSDLCGLGAHGGDSVKTTTCSSHTTRS